MSRETILKAQTAIISAMEVAVDLMFAAGCPAAPGLNAALDKLRVDPICAQDGVAFMSAWVGASKTAREFLEHNDLGEDFSKNALVLGISGAMATTPYLMSCLVAALELGGGRSAPGDSDGDHPRPVLRGKDHGQWPAVPSIGKDRGPSVVSEGL